jgi:DNA-binding NtrC family response regulator
MRQFRLLLVDDSPSLLKALSRLFKRNGYDTLTADSGAAALDTLENEEIDLIVSDENMPGMSGPDLLEICRTRYPNTVRMMLTGLDGSDSSVEGMRNGSITYCLTKPWNDEELLKMVAGALVERKATYLS